MQLSCVRVKVMRNTPVSRKLMAVFRKAKRPYAVGDLLTALYKTGATPNKTTVYRQLEKLQKEGLVRRINISDANATYETAGNAHHHHLVCERCGKVCDITLKDETQLLHAIARRGFVTKGHKLEIFGLCASCAG